MDIDIERTSVMKKKLASTKGFPLAMMIIAFLISAVCAAQEFISLFIYKKAFENPTYDYVLMEKTSEYFVKYNTACFLFLFTFIAMLTFFAGVGKKTCGYKEGVLVMFAGAAAAVSPIFKFLYLLGSDKFDNISSMSDGEKFRFINEIVSYCAPVLVCFLLVLAGLGLIIKVKASKTIAFIPAEQPAEAPSAMPAPVEDIPVPQPAPQPKQEVPEVLAASAEVTEPAVAAEEAKPEESVPAEENAVRKCRKCGAELNPGVKFCRYCGEKQTDD